MAGFPNKETNYRPSAVSLPWSRESNGMDIPDAEKDKIFDEFYQVNNPERNNAKGVGLGLASTKRLVMLLSGNLLFRSVEGRYSSSPYTQVLKFRYISSLHHGQYCAEISKSNT